MILRPLVALVAYSAFIASVSAAHLVKRDDDISCDGDKCIAFYSTGSAQCSSGYTRTHLEADGYAPGSYCERDCTDSEEKSCAARQCTDWENECNNTPKAKGICKDALKWCDGPVAMSKLICTDTIMGQAVKYEKDACFPADKSLDSRPYHAAVRGLGGRFIADVRDEKKKDGHVEYVCEPVHYSDGKSMATDLVTKYDACKTVFDEDDNDSGRDFVRVDCSNIPEAQWPQVKSLLNASCKKAKPWNGKSAHFQQDNFH
ncbi:hypothetical protein N7510_002379 [Penicillium lagena]|uniref:uncharacterized protein n=1 Tax=Penicillium lagena TaxID=94218 RepID=UPI002540D76A|nr:uncharacterized protein N7510_002379 [Penicillium lagena]KAJ5626070.1 hypothetical protein N7510_002379 [Penicillium lagena]